MCAVEEKLVHDNYDDEDDEEEAEVNVDTCWHESMNMHTRCYSTDKRIDNLINIQKVKWEKNTRFSYFFSLTR